jgi:hypothetical protein
MERLEGKIPLGRPRRRWEDGKWIWSSDGLLWTIGFHEIMVNWMSELMTPASQQGLTSMQLLSFVVFSVQRDRRRTERDIPGPGPALPILGTRWIYSVFGPYKMNKIHEACRGEYKHLARWIFCTPLSVDVLVTLATQYLEYPCKVLAILTSR